ncbi:threonine dehydrogenase-like Zn-dependent dehydrogenase [Novosphingobium sp. PhB165]|uniref:alcohol dehydrogenase catalytic domain-containing protein n=1 Tax=Novosphingobium sp. PhB165 TaxID=2485105 RepID=UPI001052A116|nr:alcohol dehydrogenase catalytic domain-containing protein [Novosphingobium sp. PhB165]TCM16094.1 threonine dehydrogenase-like Zn-dependent dehydrogenase [Novosphingobium sp. PhB165]
MKAAIYPGSGQPIVIEQVAEPRPGPGEVLIRVHRCGICGTDLSMTKGGVWDYGPNARFGHEYAGEIVELGREVEGFRIGERIAVLPSVACGQCQSCHAHGNNVLCRSSPAKAMVGFAEFASIPVSVATRLPSTLSLTDGALIEPLAISLYGVNFASIRPGDRVLVLGGGTVALYAIYWARRLGAGRIVAMSRSARRKDLSLAMGADAFVAYGDNEIGEVAEALGGAPQIVFECVGAEGMLTKAIQHAEQFGRIVSLGFCTAPDPIIPAIASYKCVSIQFAVGYSMKEFTYIASQMDKGHVDPKTIVTNEIPLIDLPAMFATLRGPNDETKVHVRCNEL